MGMPQRQEESVQLDNLAFKKIASAIDACAEQLIKHTEAVKSMAAASQELRDIVRKMNEILKKISTEVEGKAKPDDEGNFVNRSQRRSAGLQGKDSEI
jgi:hypothetical protein